jgi:hypothetical protein
MVFSDVRLYPNLTLTGAHLATHAIRAMSGASRFAKMCVRMSDWVITSCRTTARGKRYWVLREFIIGITSGFWLEKGKID